MANTERPISFLKDDFKNPSSGVNPASLKDSEFHVRAESFLPERRAGFRLQQKTTATAGTSSCGSCCWHIQEQVLCPVSVGWVGLSDYAWEVGSFSWEYRLFLGTAYMAELPVYALPGVIPQLAVARCWFAWDAFALYIVFLIALEIEDG